MKTDYMWTARLRPGPVEEAMTRRDVQLHEALCALRAAADGASAGLNTLLDHVCRAARSSPRPAKRAAIGTARTSGPQALDLAQEVRAVAFQVRLIEAAMEDALVQLYDAKKISKATRTQRRNANRQASEMGNGAPFPL